MTTHYQLLGVPPNADHKTIRAAYRKALKESHPDLHGGDIAAEQRSKRIIEAYTVLTEPDERANYDRSLGHGRRQRQRLLLITAFASMGIVGIGGLVLLLLLHATEPGSPVETRIAGFQAPADMAVQRAADRGSPPVQAAPEPPHADDPTLSPSPRQIAWLLIEKNGDLTEMATFLYRYPDGPEAPFALARLEQMIDAAEDGTKLEALRPIVAGLLAQRLEIRIAQLKSGGDLVTAALPSGEQTPRSAGSNGNAPSPIGLVRRPGTFPTEYSGGAPTPDTLNLAITALDRMILDDPRNPQSYMHRASVWASKGNTMRALVDYSAAISLDRTSTLAYHQRGLLWLRLGDVERALADLDRAIRMSFTDPFIYRDRGMIWYEKGRYDRAIADFDRAIKLAPGFAHPYFLRGQALRRKGDLVRAGADFDEAIRRDPTFATQSRE